MTGGWRSLAALLLASGGVVLALLLATRAPDAPPPASPLAVPPPEVVPTQPVQPLTRAALIAAVTRAASAHAAGTRDAKEASLAGRRFTLLIPFGCDGPADLEKEEGNGWSYDADSETLKVRFEAAVLTGEAIVRPLRTEDAIEAIEGFWIDRPWLFDAVCPATGTAPAPSTVPPRELAIGQIFATGAARAGRREGRAYTLTAKLPEEELARLESGLRLRIEGRLGGEEDKRPILCAGNGARRPACLIVARFDRIAITDATGDQVFAEWGG